VFYQIKTLAMKKLKMAVIFQDGGFFAIFFSVFLGHVSKTTATVMMFFVQAPKLACTFFHMCFIILKR